MEINSVLLTNYVILAFFFFFFFSQAMMILAGMCDKKKLIKVLVLMSAVHSAELLNGLHHAEPM